MVVDMDILQSVFTHLALFHKPFHQCFFAVTFFPSINPGTPLLTVQMSAMFELRHLLCDYAELHVYVVQSVCGVVCGVGSQFVLSTLKVSCLYSNTVLIIILICILYGSHIPRVVVTLKGSRWLYNTEYCVRNFGICCHPSTTLYLLKLFSVQVCNTKFCSLQ